MNFRGIRQLNLNRPMHWSMHKELFPFLRDRLIPQGLRSIAGAKKLPLIVWKGGTPQHRAGAALGYSLQPTAKQLRLCP